MDDTDRPLAVALAELARTMPDDPRRLSKVRERARRARRRRTVAQGTVVTATVGGLALGLVASGPGADGRPGTAVTQLPAAAPQPDDGAPPASAADPAALPTCAEVVAQQETKAAEVAAIAAKDGADAEKAAHAAADGLVPEQDDSGAATGADQAAKDQAATDEVATDEVAADKAPADPSAVTGAGAVQSVSAVPPTAGSTVTIAVGDGPLVGQTVTFTVDDGTVWRADKVPCQPTDLGPGTKLGFSATALGDGTDVLDDVDVPGAG